MNVIRAEYFTVEKMDSSYFNLDDIVTCNTNISCFFGRHTATGVLALVGQTVPDRNLEKDAKAEVPLFLARTINRTGIGRVQLTYPFNSRMQEALRADSRSVNLEALNQHFYRLGRHLTLLIDEVYARPLAETLLNAFLQRVAKIITKSQNCYLKATKMDCMEKRLYAIGMYTEAQYADWIEGNTEGRKKKAVPLKLGI